MTGNSARFSCRQYLYETEKSKNFTIVASEVANLRETALQNSEIQFSMLWPDRMKPQPKYGWRNPQHFKWSRLSKLRPHEISPSSFRLVCLADCSPENPGQFRCLDDDLRTMADIVLMNPTDDIRATKPAISVPGVFKLRNAVAPDPGSVSAINHDALTLAESVHQLLVSVHIALMSTALSRGRPKPRYRHYLIGRRAIKSMRADMPE